jgi:hypothetical protein
MTDAAEKIRQKKEELEELRNSNLEVSWVAEELLDYLDSEN